MNCPRCGGKIFNSFGELGCIWCGTCPPVVAEPKTPPVHSDELRQYKTEDIREQDKEGMLADYYSSMMVKDFLVEWHISTRNWARLKHVWGVTSKHGRRHRRIKDG